jgi:hypothetical protein
LVVINPTTALAFFRLDSGPATPADTPLLPGGRMVLAVTPFVTAFSAILASGSGNIFATRGFGTQV